MKRLKLLILYNPAAAVLLLMGVLFCFLWGEHHTFFSVGNSNDNKNSLISYLLIQMSPFLALAFVSNALHSFFRKNDDRFKSKAVLVIDVVILISGIALLIFGQSVHALLITVFAR
jgi:hypothetical protein